MARVAFEVPLGILPLASAPAAPEIGDTYFDTTLEALRTWDGTAWTSAGGTGVPVYVSPSPPSTTATSYVWFKTNMPNGGTDILIEDGT